MMAPEQKPGAEQPHVDHWPMWDEPLSKITAPRRLHRDGDYYVDPIGGADWIKDPVPLDIDQARRQLAERFNRRVKPCSS
jgi:hypothetical protein